MKQEASETDWARVRAIDENAPVPFDEDDRADCPYDPNDNAAVDAFFSETIPRRGRGLQKAHKEAHLSSPVSGRAGLLQGKRKGLAGRNGPDTAPGDDFLIS